MELVIKPERIWIAWELYSNDNIIVPHKSPLSNYYH